MQEVDLDNFWRDNDIAVKDPWGKDIPQVPLGISMGYEPVFAELGLEFDLKRLEEDFDFAQRVAKAYNDKAEQIVGKRLLNEKAYDPSKRFPPVKGVGELFGCKKVWQSQSWWLMECAHTPAELAAVLDRVEKLDLEKEMFRPEWESRCKEIYERHGLTPVPGKHLRGPVTLAMSIYGPENLIYLIMDEPKLAARFRDVLLKVILEYFSIGEKRSEPAKVTPRGWGRGGFSFADDNSALLTAEMYEFFALPIVKAVFERFAPGPKDTRYQHSDSDMGHLMPLLNGVGLNGANFGPNLRFKEIRAAMPRTVVHGTLRPFTFMRNDEAQIIAEVKQDCEEAMETRGLVEATSGSVNDGSRLTSLRAVMHAIQRYGRYR